MSGSPTLPLAVDLDVFKLGTGEEVVDRADVERALYALTGWQKPQHLVDAMLDVVDSYARGVRLGRVVPAASGHLVVRGGATCHRAHLDEHTCPVTVRTVVERVPVSAVEAPPLVETPLVAVPRAERRALDEAAASVEPGKRVRTGVRNAPALTPEALLAADEAALTDAQRAARHVLLTRSQRCGTCGLVRGLDEFYRDKARLTGHASRCKDCANAASAARRRKSPPGTPL